MALPKFKVMTLTDAAADRVKSIIAKSDKPIVGVRVGVKNGGCAGMSYTMDYADEAKPGDEVVEDRGVTIFIDPKVDACVPGLHVFALAQHQTQIAEVEEHEGVEAVEQGQAQNVAVEGLRAVGVRDREGDLPYLFDGRRHRKPPVSALWSKLRRGLELDVGPKRDYIEA